mmetsp:Transcript_131953/g.329126  ORF Transcript_131953/g.329126 Transcript_131953/m.329126 type:complete len:216 (-) Transcript_131953:451-1098(-)
MPKHTKGIRGRLCARVAGPRIRDCIWPYASADPSPNSSKLLSPRWVPTSAHGTVSARTWSCCGSFRVARSPCCRKRCPSQETAPPHPMMPTMRGKPRPAPDVGELQPRCLDLHRALPGRGGCTEHSAGTRPRPFRGTSPRPSCSGTRCKACVLAARSRAQGSAHQGTTCSPQHSPCGTPNSRSGCTRPPQCTPPPHTPPKACPAVRACCRPRAVP